MHKLLVAVDGSENARRALEHAIAMARSMPGLSIHLVTAHEQSLGFGVTPDYVAPERLAELQHAHSRQVLAPAKARLDEAGVPYTSEVLVGPVAQVVVERAEALGCDGIVMGARGKSPVANLLLGSVSTKVVHLARVPVTLVK